MDDDEPIDGRSQRRRQSLSPTVRRSPVSRLKQRSSSRRHQRATSPIIIANTGYDTLMLDKL